MDHSKTVVTAGWAFTDIDALASALVYADLLRFEGTSAEVVLPGRLNNTVTAEIKAWLPAYSTKLDSLADRFVVVDVSEASQIAKFVKFGQIAEIFDHRFGTDDFWRLRLGNNAHIEPVGACATLIWEQVVARGFLPHLAQASARLLYAAVISNSLNLRAQITKDRDVRAASGLRAVAGLDDDWTSRYYADQEAALLKDPAFAIRADTKNQVVPTMKQNIIIGQVEMWDGGKFINGHQKLIGSILASYGNPDWLMNVPSIREGKNYLLVGSDAMQRILERAIGAKFDHKLGQTDQLWLRKEILREIAAASLPV